jgi:flagellar biosynthetic protein FliQ
MNQDVVINLATAAMALAFKVALPLLGVALAVGLVVSIFQAVTQIQEQTLSFIPKVIGLVVVILVAGPWMLDQVVTYTQQLYERIPSLIG